MNFAWPWLKCATGLALVFLLAGCAGTNPRATSPAKPFMQAFLVHGVVRELQPAEKSVVIQHEEIPGYMPAMTMPFQLKNPKEMTGLSPGDNVSFQMIVTETNGWIEGVKKLAPSAAIPANEPSSSAPPTNAPIRIVRDVAPLNVGDALPDYSFTNEQGQAVSLSQFKGQALALTFIFTRCPFPTFCPLMSRNFAEAQEKLKQRPAAPANWHLLTLSFDPEYDTPAVLNGYAQEYHADPARWNFLTGALLDITAISEQFGVQFWRGNPGEPISHNLRTVVVDAQGRVQKIFPNNNWTSDELVAEILKAAAVK